MPPNMERRDGRLRGSSRSVDGRGQHPKESKIEDVIPCGGGVVEKSDVST